MEVEKRISMNMIIPLHLIKKNDMVLREQNMFLNWNLKLCGEP